jgi:segregation and condensation protein B
MDLSALVEALITASEDPLSADHIVELLHARAAELAAQQADSVDPAEDPAAPPAPTTAGTDEIDALRAADGASIEQVIAGLNKRYQADGRAFQLVERNTGWKLYTRPEFAGVVAHLYPGRRSERLSGPAMETLAIIAYRQPITKAAIEAVRGVSCDAMLQKLLDRELVRIAGRAELPGRPLLYETTEFFFEHFGIRTIDDLPNAHELRKLRLPEADHAADAPPPPEEQQLALASAAAARPAAEPAPEAQGP